MPWASGRSRADAFDAVAVARDEGDARAAVEQLADQREAEARRAAGDRDAQAVDVSVLGHVTLLGSM